MEITQIWSPSLVRGNDYNLNSYVNHVLVDIYFQSEFSETIFRVIYIKMSMPFREYYATSCAFPTFTSYTSNPYINYLLMDIYFKSKFSETRFRAI